MKVNNYYNTMNQKDMEKKAKIHISFGIFQSMNRVSLVAMDFRFVQISIADPQNCFAVAMHMQTMRHER